MAIDLNCDCDCPYERKTLGELYQAIRDGLGFVDLLSVGQTKTLEELRDEIIQALGLVTPMNIQVRTAGDMIEQMAGLLGMAAMTGAYAPGFEAQSLAFLNKAQQGLWRRIELDRGAESAPSVLALDADVTEKVDAEITFAYAIALAKAHYGQTDAKAYMDEAEKHLADWVQRHPPNIEGMVNQYLKSAHRTVARLYAQGAYGPITDVAFSADADETAVDYQPIYLLALANLKAKIGQGDAKGAMEEYNRYMADQMERSPANAATFIKGTLKNTQETLFRRYNLFNQERFYTWTMTAGQRFYGITENDETLGIIEAPVFVSAVASPTGGSLGPGTYTYFVVAGNADGTTTLSDPIQVTIAYGATNKVTLTWLAPTVPSGTNIILEYNVYGRSGSAAFIAGVSGVTLTYNDLGVISPGGDPLPPASNTTKPGACLKVLDPRSVHWVGISVDDNSWRPLRKGIPPILYASPQQGVPTHYDIRQCIEVWPGPVEGWQLRIKGKFGLSRFTEDSDLCTIDWQALQLMALANAKVFYKRQDAGLAKADADAYLGNLVSGTHMTARYIPGTIEIPNAVRPVRV